MRTLNVSISDIEFDKFGLKKDKFSFSDFLDLVSSELSRQNLNKSVELANKYGLSQMGLNEINKEIKAARKDAKANR